MPKILLDEHFDLARRLKEDDVLQSYLSDLRTRMADLHSDRKLQGIKLIQAEEKLMFDIWQSCGRNISWLIPFFFPRFPKKAPMSMMDRPFNMILLFMLSNHSFTLRGSRQIGKEQPYSEPVATPAGWKRMGELEVGDLVIGGDGKPCRVLEIHEQGLKPVFSVQFTDGATVRCGYDHNWLARLPGASEWQVLPFREIIPTLPGTEIPLTGAVHYAGPLNFREAVNCVQRLASTISGEVEECPGNILASILRSHLEVRRLAWRLLNREFRFSELRVDRLSPVTAQHVTDLIEGLGGVVSRKPDGSLRMLVEPESNGVRVMSRYHFEEAELSRCIVVDSPDHTYLTTRHTVTHNTVTIGTRQRTHAELFHGFRSMYVAPHTEPLNTYCRKFYDIDRAFRYPSPTGDKFKQLKQYKDYPNGSKIEMVRVQTSATPVRGKTYDECIIDETIDKDSEILVAVGKDLIPTKIIDMRVGMVTLAFDEQQHVTLDTVTAVVCRGKKHSWRIQCAGGHFVICTGSTRVFTNRGWFSSCEFISWKEAERCSKTLQAKTTLYAAAGIDPGFTTWRREHGFFRSARRVLQGQVQDESQRPISKMVCQGWDEGALPVPTGEGLQESGQSQGTSACSDSPPAEEIRGSGVSREDERLEKGIPGEEKSSWIAEGLKLYILKDGKMVEDDIVSVEYAGEQEVWDIETENHHTFFANGIAVHNCQLFDPSLEVEVLEVLNDSNIKSVMYAGTSTTTETMLEHCYQNGTQGVWHVLRDNGKTINCGNPEEVMKCIGEYCMLDPETGNPLDPLRGYYKYENPAAFEQRAISIHTPQILNPDKTKNVIEWNGIYQTMIRDQKKMIQEKLGIPVAEANQEVSESDLKRICVITDGPDARKAKARSKYYRMVVSGFDWGGSDYNPMTKTKISTTCHAVIGVSPDDRVHILHIRRHAGKDYKTILNQIVADHLAYSGGAMASDFGGGQQYHALLRTHPHIDPSRHVIFDYSAPETAICAPSKTSTLENMLMLNRTESITALYLAIVMDDPILLAPSWVEMEEYLRDFLNLNRVLIDKERGSKGRRFVYHRHPARTDDVVHALNFAYSLLRLSTQQMVIEDPAARVMLRNAIYGGNPGSVKALNPFAKALSNYGRED